MRTYILSAIAVSAVITYALRGAVFVLFRGERRMPLWLERLGEVLPSAVMAVLVVYCLKGIQVDFTGTGLPGILAAVITGLSYKWKHNTFFSIILGTGCYVMLIRTVSSI